MTVVTLGVIAVALGWTGNWSLVIGRWSLIIGKTENAFLTLPSSVKSPMTNDQ